jgi:hypothetical protein
MTFGIIALYVVADPLTHLLENFLTAPTAGTRTLFADAADTLYGLLIVFAMALTLRSYRDRITRSELAPFYMMLMFAFLLPYIEMILTNTVLVSLMLTFSFLLPYFTYSVWGIWISMLGFGELAPPSGLESLLLQYLETPYRIAVGAGAAAVWYQAVKRIFKPDLRLIVGRGQSRSARRIPLALPFIIYVIALPAMDWFEGWLWYIVWLVLGLHLYSNALPSALVICLLSIVLFGLRKSIRCSEMSSVYIVLAFVCIISFTARLIDWIIREVVASELVAGVRIAPGFADQYLHKLPDNLWLLSRGWDIENTVYKIVLELIGATVAYYILKFIFAGDLVAAVRRIGSATPPAEIGTRPHSGGL